MKDTSRNLSCLYPKHPLKELAIYYITMQNYLCNNLGTLGVYLLTNKCIFIFNIYSNYNIETLRSKN